MHKEYTQNTKGYYSPNQCLFFVLLVLILLFPFLGKRLGNPAQHIKNYSLKNIYTALTEPVISLTEHLPAAALIPIIRNAFIHSTGLEDRGEWDSFFYRSDMYYTGFSGLFGIAGSEIDMGELGSITAHLTDNSLPIELQRHISSKMLHDVAIPVPYSVHRPLRMFFFGDSQMHGLAAGMMRVLTNDRTIHIQELSVHSSGFLRSDYYNWPDKLETLLSTQKNGAHFDAAVLIMGMNDYQDMWTPEGIILTAGSPDWEEVYRKKVKTHLDIVLRFVPRVYWLGLPTVRRTDYNEKMDYIERVHCSIAQEYEAQQLVKVSLQHFAAEYGAGYISAVQSEDGRWISFMKGDGIHYTIEGGEYLMKKFLKQLRHDYIFSNHL